MFTVHSKRSLQVAGSLLFIFSVQFVIMMFISEALYPGYSISHNYISDLGVGITGPIFDTSIILLGVAVIISSYFIYKGFDSKVFSVLIALTGLGALLVGVFNESFGSIHGYVSDWTFILGPLTAIYAFRFERVPLKYISVVLGLISYFAIAMFEYSSTGIGVGGWERLIVYPFLLWGVGFGAYLMGFSEEK